MSGASANSCVIRSPRLCGFHQRDEGDQRSNLSPCLLSASDPEFAYARGFYVWSPDSGVLPFIDFLLLDDKGFPYAVLEAKSEDKSPLDGKEQARRYAHSQNVRFVILSNGNLHYF